MSYDLEKLPERIREMRQLLGLNQMELAERSGLHVQQICTYEQAKNLPSALSLICLAMALGVPTDWLLGR